MNLDAVRWLGHVMRWCLTTLAFLTFQHITGFSAWCHGWEEFVLHQTQTPGNAQTPG